MYFKMNSFNNYGFEKFGRPAPGKSFMESERIGRWASVFFSPSGIGDGPLMEILSKTGVTQYFELQSIAGSFVYDGGKIHKAPVTAQEALVSGWMGFFEKLRF